MLSDFLEQTKNIVIPKNTKLELEARFDIDARAETSKKAYNAREAVRMVTKLIEESKGNGTIEQSINFIGSRGIKQMIFLNGVQQKSSAVYYQKTRLIEPIIVLNEPVYKINLSFETKLEPFDLDSTIARIKLRYSIDMGKWRCDITLIKSCNLLNPQLLKIHKEHMLFAIQPDKFITTAPWGYADYIELEMEYIGDIKDLDASEFTKVNNLIRNYDNTDDNTDNYQRKIYEVARWIKPDQAHLFKKKFGIKQLSNQVNEMNISTYQAYVHDNITNFYLTDKIDGKRSIILIDKDLFVINDTLTKIELDKKITSIYIFDTEQYEDKFFIFDVMVFDGKLIADKPFVERMEYFTEAAKIYPAIHEKPFIKLNDYKKQITDARKQKKPYETDGFILTPSDGTYDKMQVYKYKPDKTSVDFYIKKCPARLLGIKPYITTEKLYILFVGCSRAVFQKLNMSFIPHYSTIFPEINTKFLPDYFPVQFEPSDNKYAYLYHSSEDLDGKVGEFQYREDSWHLMKIREDRAVEVERGTYYGNNYKVAELTWLSFANPLIIENMDSSKIYFQIHENPVYKSSRNFNGMVKNAIFDQFKDTEWVMDLASGKGQDLFRYAAHKMSNVVFLEIDPVALMELINRKFDFAKDSSPNSMSISTQQIDLNNPYKDNIEQLNIIKIPNGGVNLIVCNFAFHYLIGSKANLLNIIKFIDHYLKPGGRFIMTAFDGATIVNLLRGKSEWNSHASDKFSIRKLYMGDILEPIGQKISVLLPFSKDYYTEYLVNINYIEKEFNRVGLTLEINQSFSEFEKHSDLEDDDKLYTGLYHYYCFYKSK